MRLFATRPVGYRAISSMPFQFVFLCVFFFVSFGLLYVDVFGNSRTHPLESGVLSKESSMPAVAGTVTIEHDGNEIQLRFALSLHIS